MAYDWHHSLQFTAPQRMIIFRWAAGEDQKITPVLVGVTSDEALRLLLDFVIAQECQMAPRGWERATYRGPYRSAPPGFYALPRDLLDVSSDGIRQIAGGTVDEVRRVLSHALPLLIGRVPSEFLHIRAPQSRI